jgi:hypothetical protein
MGRALLLLFAAGTIGAAIYLNLRAGPSFGHGILPADAPREARERDYFFVLGWWTWGCWAGYGAVRAARALRIPPAIGFVVALAPLVANWRQVDRSRGPEAALPRMTAHGLLDYLPPNAVLFVAGDNDSYPLWYAQQSLGLRRDVVVITTPLLPAQWYRAELRRRHGLLSESAARSPGWWGRHPTMRDIAAQARALRRPVALAMTMPPEDRTALAPGWTAIGPILVAGDSTVAALPFSVDTVAARRWNERLEARVGGRPLRPATDGTNRYMLFMLRCPDLALSMARSGAGDARTDSLARLCNFK